MISAPGWSVIDQLNDKLDARDDTIDTLEDQLTAARQAIDLTTMEATVANLARTTKERNELRLQVQSLETNQLGAEEYMRDTEAQCAVDSRIRRTAHST